MSLFSDALAKRGTKLELQFMASMCYARPGIDKILLTLNFDGVDLSFVVLCF